MTSTKTIAAAAAVTLLAGLGTAATTATSQAQAGHQGVTAPKAAAKFEVTATVSSTEPVQGDKIKIKGSVKPGTPGAKVILQKRYGTSGEWKQAGTDTLNSKGRFKFKDKTGSVRFRQYRVVKPAAGDTKAGKSKKLGVTVYGWRNLTSLSPVSATGTGETSTVNINAKAYPESVVGNDWGNSGLDRLQHQPRLQDLPGPVRAQRHLRHHRDRRHRASPPTPLGVRRQLRPDRVGSGDPQRHGRLPDHRRLDLDEHRGHSRGPVRRRHRGRIAAFALQLLRLRRTVGSPEHLRSLRCDV